MIRPSAEIYTALYKAAEKHRIPLTVLETLAFDGSGFDPKKKTVQPGAATKHGLFGFTDAQLEAYGVVDPYDPKQAIEGACYALKDIFKHLPDVSMALAAWKLGNVLKVAHLPGTTPETWPTDTRRQVQRLVRIRYWFQDRGLPTGTGPVERLDNAIRNLTDLNMGTESALNARAAISVARDAMMAYHLRGPLPDVGLFALKDVWLKYVDAFDTAPITTDKTPVPERIEPSWWLEKRTEFSPVLKDIKGAAKDLGGELGERIDQLIIGGFALAAVLGIVSILANSRKRSA